MDKIILNQLFEIAKKSSTESVEINPFFQMVVLKQNSTINIWGFDHTKYVLDDNYTSIELDYPRIFGVINEERRELIIDKNIIKRKC